MENKLTPKGNKVCAKHHGSRKEHHVKSTSVHGALLDDADGKRRRLRHGDLDSSKGSSGESKEDEENNNSPVTPGVSRATPLQGKQQRHDGWDEKECAERVELRELLGEREVALGLLGEIKEVEEDESGGADGEVHIEAPSPRDSLGEGASDEGTGDGCKAEYHAEEG